jgi:phage tail sheath gpL-like
MAISDAVNSSLVSKVTGYKIGKLAQNSTQNLPMRIAIIGEANTANQSTLDNEPTEILTANQGGLLYGFGSPIYHALRVLLPLSGSGVSGIPVVVYAQTTPGGATAKQIEVATLGTATANTTHTVRIAGRTNVDGQSYSFAVNIGDTSSEISEKIEDAINAVIGSPVSATSTDYEAVLTSKWEGATSDELQVYIETNGNDAGLTYAIQQLASGSGTPDVQTALNMFGSTWNTIVVNCYGSNSTVLNALEDFNGIPDPTSPTGRYSAITMKPFFALFGSTIDNPTTITDTRKAEVTNVLCPSPLSEAFSFEAAANGATLLAVQAQNNPHMDISGQYYPDMPIPVDGNIGSMATYSFRDAFVKKGASTVELFNEKYKVCDFVTTYHPDGEVIPQFRYVRSLVQDLNIFYGYYLLEQQYVVDKVIANNDAVVSVTGVIKPKDWKQILSVYFDGLERRAIIVDSEYSKETLQVGISESNPDRLETAIKYKRSSFGRISSTNAEAGFNIGTN